MVLANLFKPVQPITAGKLVNDANGTQLACRSRVHRANSNDHASADPRKPFRLGRVRMPPREKPPLAQWELDAVMNARRIMFGDVSMRATESGYNLEVTYDDSDSLPDPDPSANK